MPRRHLRTSCLATGSLAAALLAAAPEISAQSDSSYRQHEEAATAARKRGDWTVSRRQLLKADSALGTHPRTTVALARVDRVTGALRWLAHPRTVALAGTDGLLRVGTDLIAIQNGVEPNRVVRFTFGADGSVTGWTSLEQGSPWMREPTHGTVVDGTLYVIANSGWNAFDDAGARRASFALHSPPDSPAGAARRGRLRLTGGAQRTKSVARSAPGAGRSPTVHFRLPGTR